MPSSSDTSAEYRAAREEAALHPWSARGLLDATGPVRQKFLQGMLSNEVASLRAGQGCRAALLTPRGGVLALLRVLVREETVTLETDLARRDLVRRTLEHHRVAAPVRFAEPDAVVLALLGPRAADTLAAVGGTPPPQADGSHLDSRIAGRAVRVARAFDLPGGGFVLHVAPEAEAEVRERLLAEGVRVVGREVIDTLRVEALRPWDDADVSEQNLLHETGLVGECHSPTKGCYVGQEIVARLTARGANVNKALRGLRLGAAAHAGAPVVAEGREVGRVTTAASSPRLGPIAMGYVHRSHLAHGSKVLVEGAAATVVTDFEAPA